MRVTQIDALRGIAASSVVVYHYIYHYANQYGHTFEPWAWLDLLSLGVQLFFIISGFVIFWTVQRSRRTLDFAVSRFSRLYPAFWVAILFTTASVAVLGPDDRVISARSILANLTMFHEFMGSPHADGVYWTLSVELMFYILMGLAMATRLVRFADWICMAWLGLAALYLTTDLVPDILRQALILKYANLFAAGIAFFRLWHGQGRVLPWLVLVISMALNWLRYEPAQAAVVTAFYPAFWLILNRDFAPLKSRVLLWLGGISYPLYLIHQNIGYGIIQSGYEHGTHPAISIAIAVGLSVILAWAISTAIEKPGMHMIRGWYSKTTANWRKIVSKDRQPAET